MKLPREGRPIHYRHIDIQQDEIGHLAYDCLLALILIGYSLYLEACLLLYRRYDLENATVVIDAAPEKKLCSVAPQ